ncbi:zinc finger protein 25-like [Ochlerotatus camptorhynchus]|uniref:zinc finger protein 25-like n=1 Tax=Ochlerotatus camptorhynchus TaxID=644619 RepID=UPI0031E01F23
MTSSQPVQRCIVPGCKNFLQEWYAPFPTNLHLISRWKECIEVGTGQLLPTISRIRKNRSVVCSMHFLGYDPDDPPCYRQPMLYFRDDLVVEVERCCMCNRMDIKENMTEKDASISESYTFEQIATQYFGSGSFDENATEEYLCEECVVKLDIMFKIQQSTSIARKERDALRARMTRERILFKQNKLQQGIIISQKDLDAVVNSERTTFVDEDDYSSDDAALAPLLSEIVKPRGRYALNPELREKWEKSRLTCYLCKTIYESTDLLLSHLMLTHVDQESLHCQECNISFKRSPELNAHLAKHDPEGRPFKCSHCPLRFAQLSGKTKHESDHHDPTKIRKAAKPRPKKFVCSTCGKLFRDRNDLGRHEQFQHKGEPVVHCETCKKPFASRRNLKRHLMLVHRGERPYECKYCKVTFKQSQGLLDHVNEKHREEKIRDSEKKTYAPDYTCSVCTETFVSRRLLALHKKKHLLIESNGSSSLIRRNAGELGKELVCNLCEGIFPKGTHIITHFQTEHPGTKLDYYPCSVCGEIYFNKQQHLIHSYTHTDKYACDVCGKQHGSNDRLQLHRHTNHGIPLAEEFLRECPHCNKKFYKGSYYFRHVKTHSENQWACEICNKSYLQKFQLTIHMRTHTGEKPLVCPGCLKNFADPTTICKHKKQCDLFQELTQRKD